MAADRTPLQPGTHIGRRLYHLPTTASRALADGAASICPAKGRSDDKDHHVEANTIIRHFSEQVDKEFVKEDEVINIDEPDHEGLAPLEQQAFIECIRHDKDMSVHQDRVLTSLRIVFAADESQRTKKVVELK